MPAQLKVTLIQSELQWENIGANLQMFDQKVSAIKGSTDLIVLPEMFSTGFSMNAGVLAETMESSRALDWMRSVAAEKECAVTGSVMMAEQQPGTGEVKYFNRLLWVTADNEVQYYDKRHLFALSKEETVYTPGNEKIIVELKGWKIYPLICFDLRFPVWSRNAVDGYDVLLYVANWPERRIYAWKHLLIARAIENQAYVIGVNRVGNDGNDIYHSGDSMVVDALGNTLYHRENIEDVVTVELNYEDLKRVRETLPFLNEADAFALNPKLKIKAH